MKRLAPVLLAGSTLLCLSPSVGQAAGLSGTRHATPEAASSSPASIDVTQFRLPDSSFAPALVNPFADGRLSNAEVDLPGKNPFVQDHTHPYAGAADGQDLHRLDGYREEATWGGITFSYAVSTFTNAGWALNAYRDGLYETSNHSSGKKVVQGPQACATITGRPCATVAYNVGDQNGLYGAVQFDDCLLEVQAEAMTALFDSSTGTVLPVFSTVMRGGSAAMTKLCSNDPPSMAPTPLDFDVVVARVERAGAAADFQLQQRGLRVIHVGQTVDLSVYFSVTSAPAKSRASAEFTVKHGSGVVYFARCKPMKIKGSPNTYRMVAPFTARRAGHFTVVGRVSVDGQAQQWVTGVTVRG